MTSDAPLSQRREAAQLLVALPAPAGDRRRRSRARRATAIARSPTGRRSAPPAWATRRRARACRRSSRDAAAEPSLRVHAALALAAVGDDGGVPVLGDALDHCDDVLLCRGIIASLGKLRDRRAVPVLIKHLPEVQNRREMVEALGDIGDPAAAEALLERLRGDEYVPVRIAAAKALAKLGDARVGRAGRSGAS